MTVIEHPEAAEYSAAADDLARAADASAFKPGDRVKYVPHHAHGDQQHPECETGTVEKVTAAGVFVRFTYPMTRSWPQCCNPAQLVHTL